MKKPLGVVFVFVCEMILSLATGLLGLMYIVYGFYGLLHYDWSRCVSSVGVASVLLMIAAACYFTSSAFLDGLRWAWKASLGIGLMAGVFAMYCIYTSVASQTEGIFREGWGDGIGILILIPVLLGWAVLLLPSTRRFFQGRDASNAK
ncbi:hypothetical protein [Edaphobacter aggregans]|uniref:hypothetical protein n=1 Tax=Edaphobacter aggregans TaxID=570835 RepID=UPI0005590F77|nr:hypothetical protein [Edaphobacter aggregans]